MKKQRMGTLSILFFYICALVIAAPPLTLKAPPSKSSLYSESNLGLNLTQSAAHDALLYHNPSPPSTKLPLSSITNASVSVDPIPDPWVLRTMNDDYVILGSFVERFLWEQADLTAVFVLAEQKATRRLSAESTHPIPGSLDYRCGAAQFFLEATQLLTWRRWAEVLVEFARFMPFFLHGKSFNFVITAPDGRTLVGNGYIM